MDEKIVGRLLIVLLVLVIIVIIGIIYKIIVDKIFQNSISQSKLALTSGIENKDDEDVCYLYISNRSFTNVIVQSFGFKDKLKETDYIKKYKEDNEIQENQKVVIPARESIKLEVSFEELYKLFEGFKIGKIQAYTLDTLGFRRTKKAKVIRKQIKIVAKPIYDEKKRVLNEEKKQQKLLAREASKNEEENKEN